MEMLFQYQTLIKLAEAVLDLLTLDLKSAKVPPASSCPALLEVSAIISVQDRGIVFFCADQLFYKYLYIGLSVRLQKMKCKNIETRFKRD